MEQSQLFHFYAIERRATKEQKQSRRFLPKSQSEHWQNRTKAVEKTAIRAPNTLSNTSEASRSGQAGPDSPKQLLEHQVLFQTLLSPVEVVLLVPTVPDSY